MFFASTPPASVPVSRRVTARAMSSFRFIAGLLSRWGASPRLLSMMDTRNYARNGEDVTLLALTPFKR
jgi:hypothetical protein